MALCKAAPTIQHIQPATKLAQQLGPYIVEAHLQPFVPSPFFREIEPSPIEALSYSLSTALLALGVEHDQLKESSAKHIWSYLNNCARAAREIEQTQEQEYESDGDIETAIHSATLAISILGFLDASATYANFWSPADRLDLIQRIRDIFSDAFLVRVETAFSTLRNSHSHERAAKEWKRYMRHYAATGRPLGAMLLQRSFMWFLVAASSLLVADVDALRKSDVLDLLMTNEDWKTPLPAQPNDPETKSIEAMTDISAYEVALLEDGSDYLKLSSTWAQRIAFSVKACALTTYLNCSLLNEEVADTDVLMTWLEDTMADPIQMADDILASVVLRCMALIAKITPSFASNISRLIARYIVQGGPRGIVVTIASTSIAYVLQLLSQDAVITTLYSLGNVLSSASTTEKALNGVVHGEKNGGTLDFYAGRHSTGSAISLQMTGDEETAVVYGNIVQAIGCIASHCQDEKITALVQAMLLQQVDKLGKSVDARIITEAAVLSLSGGILEFRSLLKLYAKISNYATVDNNEPLLSAVSCLL